MGLHPVLLTIAMAPTPMPASNTVVKLVIGNLAPYTSPLDKNEKLA
jgi:hypothetical protein